MRNVYLTLCHRIDLLRSYQPPTALIADGENRLQSRQLRHYVHRTRTMMRESLTTYGGPLVVHPATRPMLLSNAGSANRRWNCIDTRFLLDVVKTCTIVISENCPSNSLRKWKAYEQTKTACGDPAKNEYKVGHFLQEALRRISFDIFICLLCFYYIIISSKNNS